MSIYIERYGMQRFRIYILVYETTTARKEGNMVSMLQIAGVML